VSKDGEKDDKAASRPKKRTKKSTAAAPGTEDATAKTETTADAEKPATKSRFILFIGNLPFKTTNETLTAHFKSLQPFNLRHRTDPKTKKSKGFAFLEFENYDRMKTCLKLYHHSMFDPEAKEVGGSGKGNGKAGRKINVELTAGGGGKTEGRKEKIKVKNERLEEQRKRRAEVERKEKERKEKKEGKKTAAAGGKTDKEVESEPNVDLEAIAAAQGIHPSRLRRGVDF
jgi:nucleolar protein 6